MTFAAPMLETYPAEINLDRREMARVIDAVAACAQACTACADACLSESSAMLPALVKCIRDNLDCADICDATVRVLSRHTGYDANLTRAQVEAALVATRTCRDSCAEHEDMHEHCRVCAQACAAAGQALAALIGQLQPSGHAPASPSQTAPNTAATAIGKVRDAMDSVTGH